MGQILLLLDEASPVVNFHFSGWNLLPLCGLYDLGTGHHHCFHAGWYLCHHSHHKTSFSIAFISYIFQILSPLKSLVLCFSQVDIMKTRLQSMKYVDGVPEYKGAADVLSKVTLKLPLKDYIWSLSSWIVNFRLLKMRDSSRCGKASPPTTSDWAPTLSSPSYSLSRSPIMLFLVPCAQIDPFLEASGRGDLKSTRNSYLNTGFFPRAQFLSYLDMGFPIL